MTKNKLSNESSTIPIQINCYKPLNGAIVENIKTSAERGKN